MFFGNIREYSVKIGTKKSFGCLPENAGRIPSAVVIMYFNRNGNVTNTASRDQTLPPRGVGLLGSAWLVMPNHFRSININNLNNVHVPVNMYLYNDIQNEMYDEYAYYLNYTGVIQ